MLRWTQGFALVLVTRTVAADPAPPPPVASAEPPVSTATDGARYSDAHSDRVLLFPTGETHPTGTFFVSSYDIAGLRVGYALTDRFELELTAVLPWFADAAAKLNVLRSDLWRIATYGALDVPIYDFGPPVYRAGVTGQLCLSKSCWSSISLSAMGAAGQGRGDSWPVLPLILFTWRTRGERD